jgi:hypothetical protein
LNHRIREDFRARVRDPKTGLRTVDVSGIFVCSFCHTWARWDTSWKQSEHGRCSDCAETIVSSVTCSESCRLRLSGSSPIAMRTMEAAIAYATERALRDQATMRVYHVAHDQYGRDAVFYVRSETEGRPDDRAVTVTVIHPDGSEAVARGEERPNR